MCPHVLGVHETRTVQSRIRDGHHEDMGHKGHEHTKSIPTTITRARRARRDHDSRLRQLPLAAILISRVLESGLYPGSDSSWGCVVVPDA